MRVNRAPFNLIPQKWAFDPEIGPFIRDILEMMFQLRERSGGDDDQVSNIATRSSFSWSRGSEASKPPTFHAERSNIMEWL